MKIDIDRVEIVTPDTLIGDLVLWHPEATPVLYAIGMHCLGCPASGAESIREAADVHGVDADELVALLNERIAADKDKKIS